MNCKQFQILINSFLDDTLEFNDIEPFICHLDSCKDCYDELEISFLVKAGLDSIDEKGPDSYDFKGKFAKKIAFYRKYIDDVKKHNRAIKFMFIASQIIVLLMFIEFSIEYIL